MKNEEIIKCFSKRKDLSIGSAAMLLALTWNLNLEEEVKQFLNKEGIKHVVTEIGGKSFGEFQEKTTKAVIGACINSGLIKRETSSIHALLHATEEAKRGLLVNTSSSTSLAIKIAIVRNENWIAVAMFGLSAIHPLTNHERAGLGIMHIRNLKEEG